MDTENALKFADQYFSSPKSYQVCFPLAFLAWFLQVMALGTQNWTKTSHSTTGLWTYCNYTSTDFMCCQSVENFLAKTYNIPRVPVWLSASRIFEIFGFMTSFIFLTSFVVFIAVLEADLKKKVKTFSCVSCMTTVIFVLIGGFVYAGEYSKETWMNSTTLSSSFGVCFVSAFFHFICFLILVITNDSASQTLDIEQQWTGPASALGTNEFWEEIIDHPTTPKYWDHFEGGYHVKRYLGLKTVCKTSDVSPQVLNAVLKLVQKTWYQHYVGMGADARNINYSSIFVRNVQRIENVDLWHNYVHAREKIIRSLLKDGPIQKLEDKHSRGSIYTSRYMDDILKTEVHPELNECLLFHGTKPEVVDNIMQRGMDPRHAADRSMMGRGNYCAESSTKSDQYADTSNYRQNVGLKMFLVRMLLGRIYIAYSPHQYKVPPCTQCLHDSCKNKNHLHFNSVVADIPNKIFREFIVYDANQCYPEYVITYDRI